MKGSLSAAMVIGTMVVPAFADDSTATVVDTLEAFKTALTDTNVKEITVKGTIDVSSVSFSNVDGTKIKGDPTDGEDVLQLKGALGTKSIDFEDLTMEWPNANYQGFTGSTKITYNNVKIIGQPFLYAAEEIFNNCTFTQTDSETYNVWTYGAKYVEFNDCTFNSAGKSVLIYNEGAVGSETVNVKECTFNASTPVEGKAAIEIDSSLLKSTGAYNLNITGNTTATGFGTGSTSGNSLYNVKKYQVVTDDTAKKLNTEIKVDGEVVMPLSDEKMAEVFKTAVAQNGSKFYETLKDAVAAAQDGDTVKLLADTTESIEVGAGKNITLDLNGKTLTNEDGEHTIENHGTLTVEDKSQDKTAKVDNISNGKIPFVNYEGGNATLNGGSFDRSNENGKVGRTDDGCNSGYTIKNWGIMTINEGVIVNNKSNGSNGSSTIGNGYQNGLNYDSHTSVTSADVKLTINGGKFTGGLNTIKNDDWAKLEVNGGVFENYTQQCIMNWNEAVITGGKFTGKPNGNVIYNAYDNDSMDKGTLEISGGEFDGKFEIIDPNKKGKMSISGGSFSTDISKYCADGYKPTKVNGRWVVGEDNSTDEISLRFDRVNDRTYDIVLVSADKKIYKLNAAQFKFALTKDASSADVITYEIAPVEKMALIPQKDDVYELHFDGKDGVATDSGKEVKIGTVTFDGFGKFTFGATEGKVTATTEQNNLVTEFTTNGTTKGTLKLGTHETIELTVPQHTLTINIAMNHKVTDNVKAYQNMTVEISGGNLGTNTKKYELGTDGTPLVKLANGVYTIKEKLDENGLYTVTVKGAGYRTARYTVALTDDKIMNLWNNVMTAPTEVVVGTGETTQTNFLAGDIIRDNIINIYDLSAVVAYFGTNNLVSEHKDYAKYDLNRDGKIDMMDISIVLTSWGN